MNFVTPVSSSSVVEVTYASDELIQIEASETGGADTEYTVKANGIIADIWEPQGVTRSVTGMGTDSITVTLGRKTGNHTFFYHGQKE